MSNDVDLPEVKPAAIIARSERPPSEEFLHK